MSTDNPSVDRRPTDDLCRHNFVEVEFHATLRVAVDGGTPVVMEAAANMEIQPFVTCVDCGLMRSAGGGFTYPDHRFSLSQPPSEAMIAARIAAECAVREAPRMISILPGGSAQDAARLERSERLYRPTTEMDAEEPF